MFFSQQASLLLAECSGTWFAVGEGLVLYCDLPSRSSGEVWAVSGCVDYGHVTRKGYVCPLTVRRALAEFWTCHSREDEVFQVQGMRADDKVFWWHVQHDNASHRARWPPCMEDLYFHAWIYIFSSVSSRFVFEGSSKQLCLHRWISLPAQSMFIEVGKILQTSEEVHLHPWTSFWAQPKFIDVGKILETSPENCLHWWTLFWAQQKFIDVGI